MDGRTFILVDSRNAIDRACADHANGHLATDNPLLAHDPRHCTDVEDISNYLEQAEATSLGRAATDILLDLDDRLAEAGAVTRYGGASGRLNITMCMRALLASLIQRSAMLSRALDAFNAGPLVMMAVDAPRWEPTHPWAQPWHACPFRELAEYGFFGTRDAHFEAVETALPTDVNDTRVDDVWLRALLLPPSMLVYEISRILRFDRAGWRNGISVGKPAEALRETLPWLVARGFRLGGFEIPAYAGEVAPTIGTPVSRDKWLDELCSHVITGGILATGAFKDHEAQAITSVLLDHLSAGLRSLEGTRRALEVSLDKAFSGRGRKTLLTSGYYGPIAGQLHALCRGRGITLIDVEHGATTGIAHTSERRLKVGEVTTSDILVVSSPAASRSFGSATDHDKPRIEVVGLADQTRRMFHRGIQRRRARRRLGLASDECAVVYVSTLLYGGNKRPGDDSPVESYVFKTESRLLNDVFPSIGKTVLFKPYPAQRFVDQPSYDELFSMPTNVRLIDWADFRFVRAAADIIVTTANSSTIGWCVGADVPLVHLGSGIVHTLVDDDLRSRFDDAFLTINLDREEWAGELADLLARPPREIADAWQAKSGARRDLLEDAIAGPRGSVGRRIAAHVARAHA